jgi:hypothetical protein
MTKEENPLNALYSDYIAGLVSSGEVEIASEEYGTHLPARNVGARVYVLRKR